MRRLDSPDVMLVGANVLWALNYASTKFAMEAWQPLAYSQLRFAAAGLLSCSVVLVREGSLRVARADVALVVAAATTGIFLNQVLFNYAVALSDAEELPAASTTPSPPPHPDPAGPSGRPRPRSPPPSMSSSTTTPTPKSPPSSTSAA